MPLQVRTSFASFDDLRTELLTKLDELGGSLQDLALVHRTVVAPSKAEVEKAKHDALLARARELGIDSEELS